MAEASGFDRLRGPVSAGLAVLAVVAALAGGVALYVQQEVVSSDAFADRAVAALENPDVRRVVSREIVVGLIDQGSTDLISARPVVESVVQFVVASEPFRRVFRLAALNGHKLLFVRDARNVAFDIADAGTVVVSALRSVAPDIAREIPKDADATLLKVRQRSFARDTLAVADHVRTLGSVLPVVALLLAAGAVAVARDRRRVITRMGVGAGIAGGALFVAVVVFRVILLNNVYGEDEVTNADVRAAIGGIYDAFLGDLGVWGLAVGAFGLLVAAASASLLRPFAAGAGLAKVRRALAPPPVGWRRALHGAGFLLAGIFVVLEPSTALEIVAVVGGGLLVYYGTGELLSNIHSPEAVATRRAGRARRRRLIAAGAGAAALVGGVAIALFAAGRSTERAAASVDTCNGYRALCGRRLDEVTFPGTHNSMSAADSPGWLLANQTRRIRRQLRDGIRLFLIDPHYGVKDARGKVRTDLEAEGRDLNRLAKQLSPEAIRALGRFGGRIGFGNLEGKREVWLCHTVCELGATRMVDVLRTFRTFLERNPGEVLVVFDEDYVKEADLAKAYADAGLTKYLAVFSRLKPLPTLGQLIKANRRLIVFTERRPGGEYPWNLEGFSWVQDTPLKATKGSQFTCAENRGFLDSPLLMVNHWIDKFPPPLQANKKILTEDFILQRLRRCERERGMKVNLIASDFYDQGGLVKAVAAYNGVGSVPAARTR